MRWVVALLVCCLLTGTECQRVKDLIYLNLSPSTSGCFRILNGTHQIGCSTKAAGSIGVIQLIESLADVVVVETDQFRHAPYVAVFHLDYLYSLENVRRMQKSGNLAGVILLNRSNTTITKRPYSDDNSCPNYASSYYNASMSCGVRGKEWNEGADAFWFQSFDIPIFLVSNDTEVDLIQKCYTEFNKPENSSTVVARRYPLCAAQMTFQMEAALDSPTCMRRANKFGGFDMSGSSGLCDPLGSFNLFAVVPPAPLADSAIVAERSVLVLAVRFDSLTMFDKVSPGAETVFSGLIALLAAAQAVGARNVGQNNKRILFAFFNGEALDYIGSSRMVYDMEHDAFPAKLTGGKANQSALINVSHIGAFLEISQIGLAAVDTVKGPKFFGHADFASYGDATSSGQQIVDQLQNSLNVEFKPDANRPLPPSSGQSFLKLGKNKFPVLMLTGYKDVFRNQYYHSFKDSVDQQFPDLKKLERNIVTVANSIAQLADWWLTGTRRLDIAVEEKLVDTLISCFYVTNGTCDVFSRIWDSFKRDSTKEFMKKHSDEPLMTYVGPSFVNSVTTSQVSFYAASFLLSYFLQVSNVTVNQSSSCEIPDDVFSYVFMSDLFDSKNLSETDWFCIKTPVKQSEAKSPAFIIPGYDFKSGLYSTWVESKWDGLGFRLFLQPSLYWEVCVFCVGILVLILSFGLGYVITNGSQTLFTSGTAPVAV